MHLVCHKDEIDERPSCGRGDCLEVPSTASVLNYDFDFDCVAQLMMMMTMMQLSWVNWKSSFPAHLVEDSETGKTMRMVHFF